MTSFEILHCDPAKLKEQSYTLFFKFTVLRAGGKELLI